jgi:ABC-type uncharacterized transport system involved in gliding motility auxiliary subunit
MDPNNIQQENNRDRRFIQSQNKVRTWLSNNSLTLSLSGIVILLASFAIYITVMELRSQSMILMAVALVMILIAFVTRFTEVREAVTARSGQYTTNTIVMITAFTIILLLLGYISFENSLRLDMTSAKQFTLAPQTKEILKKIDQPIRVTGYFDPNDSRQELAKRTVDDFFHEFNRTSSLFTYEFVDPDLKPSQARRDGIQEYPTLVFKIPDSKNKPHLFTPYLFDQQFEVSEQHLVSSLLITTGLKQKAIYFTTGHGEREVNDANDGSDGYGFARRGLLGENYRICTVNLKQIEFIPTEGDNTPCGQVPASVLIIAGPTGGFLNHERDIIEKYLLDGGRLLLLIDGPNRVDINKTLSKWGVKVADGSIIDLASSSTGDPRSPIIQRDQYNLDNRITKVLDNTFFTEAIAIQDVIKRAPEGLPLNPDEKNITLTPLAFSSPFSCYTSFKDQNDCYAVDSVKGPHVMAMAVEAKAPVGSDTVVDPDAKTTSIVIFGDSDFASNKFYYAFSNGDFFINSVDWLAERYDLISIRSKPVAFRQLILTQKEFDFIRYSSWFLLPLGIILLAGISWWNRR